MKIHLCILPLKQKLDGTFSVKVRIYNREISSYITTDICVLITKINEASALLERFICNNKLRKREIKSLRLIIDYLNS